MVIPLLGTFAKGELIDEGALAGLPCTGFTTNAHRRAASA
jgi:hypothetical protein